MRATPISGGRPGVARWPWLALLCALGLLAPAGRATNESVFKERAEAAYLKARNRFATNQTDVTITWEFARACFDRAEFAASDSERAGLARNGIAACQQAAARHPKSAAVQYYLGMNLGQLARTKTIGALPLVVDMEEHFKTTAVLDKQFDYAGPDRNLGLLYLDAPGWPASIGNKKKAREHLMRSVELAPDIPKTGSASSRPT